MDYNLANRTRAGGERLTTRGQFLRGAAAAGAGVALLGAASKRRVVQAAAAGPRPNVVLVLADDLDRYVYARMARMRGWFGEGGLSFENFFTTTSVCVVSRCTFLTGKYAHNHGVTQNTGGASKFRDTYQDRSTVATWMKDAGYVTWFGGKYLNSSAQAYGTGYTPPGWGSFAHYASETRAIENGRKVDFSPQLYTPWLANRAVAFLRNRGANSPPFFMEIATKDPHEPMQYRDAYADDYRSVKLPDPPSFNEADLSDKPAWVQEGAPISAQEKLGLEVEFRERLRAMKMTEDLVARVLANVPPNTYVLFASDNGFHQGLHRIHMRKWTPYTEACRVPFAVRGPGVAAGSTSAELVGNIDVAPTIAGLAGVAVPPGVDGRDLSGLFRGEPLVSPRKRILLEGSPDSVDKEYAAVREADRQYVEWSSGDKELYLDTEDPYQLDSRHGDPAYAGERERLAADLAALKACSGGSCGAAEGP